MGREPPSVPPSESELDQFFDLALDLMVIAGFDGYWKRVNRSFERTLGYPSRELLSRPFWDRRCAGGRSRPWRRRTRSPAQA